MDKPTTDDEVIACRRALELKVRRLHTAPTAALAADVGDLAVAADMPGVAAAARNLEARLCARLAVGPASAPPAPRPTRPRRVEYPGEGSTLGQPFEPPFVPPPPAEPLESVEPEHEAAPDDAAPVIVEPEHNDGCRGEPEPEPEVAA